MKFIFISGASGSGKTTLAKSLLLELTKQGACVVWITMDDYSVEVPKHIVDIQKYRQETNFDRVEMYDLVLLSKHVYALAKGNVIEKPIFDFPTNTRKAFEIIRPANYIIIEGLYALHFAKTLDVKINKTTVFIGQSSYLSMLERRTKRDVEERKFTPEQVVYKERRFVGPSFFNAIAKSKIGVDIDITNDKRVDGKMDPILMGVKEIISYLHFQERQQKYLASLDASSASAVASPVVTAAVAASPVVTAAVAASPVVTAAVAASPVVTAAVAASPVVTAAVAASPVVTAAVAASPVVTAAVAASPVVTAAVAASPVVTAAVAASPVVTAAVAASPVVTAAVAASPVVTAAVAASPVVTSAVAASPVVTSAVAASPVVTSAVAASPVVTAAVAASPVVTAAVAASPVVTAAVAASPVVTADIFSNQEPTIDEPLKSPKPI